MKVKRILSSILATVMVATSLVTVNVSNVWAATATATEQKLVDESVTFNFSTAVTDGTLTAGNITAYTHFVNGISLYSNSSRTASISAEQYDSYTHSFYTGGSTNANGRFIGFKLDRPAKVSFACRTNAANTLVGITSGLPTAQIKEAKHFVDSKLYFTSGDTNVVSKSFDITQAMVDANTSGIFTLSVSGSTRIFEITVTPESKTATANKYEWNVVIPDGFAFDIKANEIALKESITEGADSTNELVYTGTKYNKSDSFPTSLKLSDATLDEGTQIGDTEFKKYTATVTLNATWFVAKPTYKISGNVVETKTSNGTLAANAKDKTFTLTNKADNTITADATISADGTTYSSATEVVAGTYKITGLSVNDYSLVSDEVTIAESGCSDIAFSFNSSATVTKKWDLSKSLVAGDNGNGLYAMEAMASATDGNGVSSVQGTTNPSKNGNNVTGAALKLVPKVDGFWKLSWKTTTSKGAAFALQGATSLTEQKESGTGDFKVSTYEVKAGNTYFFYGTGGTKLTYNDITFIASTSDDFEISEIKKTTSGHLVVGKLKDMNFINDFDKVGIALSKDGSTYTKLPVAESTTLYSSVDVGDETGVATGKGLFAVLVDVPEGSTLYAKGYALISGTKDKYVEQATGMNS